MKPPRFEYHCLEKLAEARDLLREFGDDAKLLAGGQSLMPLLNMRLARPAHLLDINRIDELNGIDDQPGWIEVGALARHRALERSSVVRSSAPMLSRAAALVGHLAIRNRGTFGGSVCHADPSAELPLAALALGATFIVQGPERRREIAADDFFVGPLTTCLEPTEMLLGARIPKWSGKVGWAFLELARRPGDFAIVAVAALVMVDESRRVVSLRVALGGLDTAALVPAAAIAPLLGVTPTQAVLAEVGRSVASSVEPPSDVHASATYRRLILRTMFPNAVADAIRRATEATEAAHA